MPEMFEFVSEKPVTFVPKMAWFWKSLSCIRSSEMPTVLRR
jgi:hypothetical protein